MISGALRSIITLWPVHKLGRRKSGLVGPTAFHLFGAVLPAEYCKDFNMSKDVDFFMFHNMPRALRLAVKVRASPALDETALFRMKDGYR
jgi:hypothetical protein